MDQEEKLALGARIWGLRKAGYDRIEVLREMGITVAQFEDSLREFESQLSVDAGHAMAESLLMNNEQIEEVITSLLPVALGDHHPLETANDSEYDLALRAGYAVLGCINARCKIFAASRPEKHSVRERSVDILAWLQQNPPNTNGHAE